MPITSEVVAYAVELVRKTRPNTEDADAVATKYLSWGAGPRASQNLVLAAKAMAMMEGKGSPSIETIQRIAIPVLRHRIVANYRAKGEGISEDDIIKRLF